MKKVARHIGVGEGGEAHARWACTDDFVRSQKFVGPPVMLIEVARVQSTSIISKSWTGFCEIDRQKRLRPGRPGSWGRE
jgi:hypothetical protein